MKQLTFQFEGSAPSVSFPTGELGAIKLALNAIILKLSAAIERCTGAALTHRHAVGGVALMGGMALASGADSIPQALATLAAFAVAAMCLNDLEEKGGEA